MCNTASDDVSK